MTHGERIAEEWFSKFKVYGDVEDGKQELASLIDSDEVLAALEEQNRALKASVENDSWSRELQDALEAIPTKFIGNDYWVNGIKRMAEVLAALEKDKEALDRFSATADALREHLLNNPCLNCDIPDEIYVPFSEAIDAALAPTKTEG